MGQMRRKLSRLKWVIPASVVTIALAGLTQSNEARERESQVSSQVVTDQPMFLRDGSDIRVSVEDIFGRSITRRGITLVDWDGYMANPAIKFFILPPTGASFPVKAVLSANNPRLYFSLPSTVGKNGPTKELLFENVSSRVPVYLGNAPDRDSEDGEMELEIRFTDAQQETTFARVPIHEIDQDRRGAPANAFKIDVDFSEDQTGFFSAARSRHVILQEVADWAYFFDDMNLDRTPAGAETTFIWNPDGFVSGHFVTNNAPYTGYLLYVYGIHSAALRSGGEVSAAGGFQSSGGVPLQLKRSGGVEVETAGNFNELGWRLGIVDRNWWVSGNLGNERNELFSIAHHETRNAIAFNASQPKWQTFKTQGCVSDPLVIAYQGLCPSIDSFDHLSGTIDKESLKGAFGNEYFGMVPSRRWFITKLDLLVAQAIAYKLRKTSAFVPLALLNGGLPNGVIGRPYAAHIDARGGIPFYNYTIVQGSLPDGLVLDAFAGEVTGVPRRTGTFAFTVRVQDYSEGSTGISQSTTITINGRP